MATRTEIMQQLERLVPIVERVHGDNHKELHDVSLLFEELEGYYQSDRFDETSEIFEKLKHVTNNYQLPEDACQGYQELYSLLQQLEQRE